MKKVVFYFTTVLLLSSGCNKEAIFDGPSFYEDGFEDYNTFSELFIPDDVLWSFSQITEEGNKIEVDSTRAHTGSRAMKFTAVKSAEGVVSKASIAKQNMAFWEGEVMRVSAWFYIEGTEPLEWLFLFDLEEQAAIGAGPGIRLALVDDALRMEYKFLEDDIVQPEGAEIKFPRNQWVEIVWEVMLSQKDEGTVRLWQNGELLLNDLSCTTLPKDILYFQQGTKGMYSSTEIGITANSRDNDLTLWVDDVRVEKL